MPGINDWAIEMAARKEKMPIQNSMDGTRIIYAVELYRDHHLIGEEFSPDVQSYPTELQLPTMQNSR